MRSVRHALLPGAPGITRAVLLRSVGVTHGHANDHNRMDDGRRRSNAGIRRPVRTMTEPPTPSRRMRLGLPTSPVVSGVMVAAFSPRPVSRMAAAAWRTTSLAVTRRFPSERSNRSSSRSNPSTPGSKTRSASSSNSWPVSSPSQTTIWRPGDTVLRVPAAEAATPRRFPLLQAQALRVAGMPLEPVGPGTTPSTWWMEIPPSSNPLAEAAM